MKESTMLASYRSETLIPFSIDWKTAAYQFHFFSQFIKTLEPAAQTDNSRSLPLQEAKSLSAPIKLFKSFAVCVQLAWRDDAKRNWWEIWRLTAAWLFSLHPLAPSPRSGNNRKQRWLGQGCQGVSVCRSFIHALVKGWNHCWKRQMEKNTHTWISSVW